MSWPYIVKRLNKIVPLSEGWLSNQYDDLIIIAHLVYLRKKEKMIDSSINQGVLSNNGTHNDSR